MILFLVRFDGFCRYWRQGMSEHEQYMIHRFHVEIAFALFNFAENQFLYAFRYKNTQKRLGICKKI